MRKCCFKIFLSLLLLFLWGCSSSSEDNSIPTRYRNQKGEYIYRNHDEYLFAVQPPEKVLPLPYPWEKGLTGNYPRITKEFFRCKGNSLDPCHIVSENEEIKRYYDCGGIQKHSLPLRDNKEFIYPILIDLVNYIQAKNHKRVVITSGHRCPEHNAYTDPSTENQTSKHMLGAEVSFYVQGLKITLKC